MAKFIVILLIAAGLYFAYINMDKINTNVDKSIKTTTQQMQNEKTINAVGSGRERTADEVKDTVNKAF